MKKKSLIRRLEGLMKEIGEADRAEKARKGQTAKVGAQAEKAKAEAEAEAGDRKPKEGRENMGEKKEIWAGGFLCILNIVVRA